MKTVEDTFLIIRNMTIHDYDKIYQIWYETKGISLRVLDDSKEGTDRFLRRNPTTNFVCEIENEIIAVILCGHDGRKGFIYHTVVVEKHRNKGIGKKLVEEVCKALDAEGISKVAIVVYSDNDAGKIFWDNLDFKHLSNLDYKVRYLTDKNILLKY
ncbi:MAG: GNAT family N-acetyltransferase [Spirochaetales bacterium]|nr:GNAT family N-acetyltransferase [Spirochaetales bacterium]